jgi:hemolysin III
MRSIEEEVINSITHLVWGILSLLIFIIVLLDDQISIKNKSIFWLMIGLSFWTFLSSYIYHSSYDLIKKERNRLVDRSAIYLMILGGGIAANLTCVDQTVGVCSSIILAVLCACFTIALCIKRNLSESFVVSSYILLGWGVGLPALGLLGPSGYTETNALWYFLLGGVFYSVGVIFYARDSIKWYHTIWHFFVMVGFMIHVFAALVALKIF